jgi:hypothetical protein
MPAAVAAGRGVSAGCQNGPGLGQDNPKRIQMDETSFDALSRGVGSAHSRRTVTRLLAASLAGSLGLGGVGSVSARHRRWCRPRCAECERCRRGKCKPVKDYRACTGGTCSLGTCCNGAVCNLGTLNEYCCIGGTCLATAEHGTLCCGSVTCPPGSARECCPPGPGWQCCPEGSKSHCIGEGDVCCPEGSIDYSCPPDHVCCETGSGESCCPNGKTCDPSGCID